MPRLALLAVPVLLAGCASVDLPKQVKLPPVAVPPKQVPAPLPSPLPSPTPVPSPVEVADTAALQAQIHEMWRNFPGKTGIAILSVDKGWQIGERMGEYFPQQSVSKLWVAMTVLDQVDSGRLRLDQLVKITTADLAVMHQPIRERVLANGGVLNESIASLLEQALTASDCTANDSLLRTAGGPDAVRAFIASRNLGKIRFGPGERPMQAEIAGLTWQQSYSLKDNFFTARAALPYDKRSAALGRYLADPVDGASPEAIVGALAQLVKGDLLSPASTAMLLGILGRVRTGPERLKGGLQPGWTIGHKTGTGQQLDPVTTGYNDVAIITAPDGQRYTIAVMLADTTASNPSKMAFMRSVSGAVVANHR